MIAAFFDVDNTVIPGTSVERLFFRYLLSRKVLSIREVMETAAFILRSSLDLSGMAVRSRRIYLHGKPVPLIEQMAERCFEEVVRPRISREARERIQIHRDRGDRVVLITGSLDILVEKIGRELKADAFIASDTERVQGHFSGRIRLPVPYGKGKEFWLETYAREHDIDLARSYAYGDSLADRWIFYRVGYPFVVNGGWRLRQVAWRKGWRVLRWNQGADGEDPDRV